MQISSVTVSPLILLGFLVILGGYEGTLAQENLLTNILRGQIHESLRLVILPEKDVFEPQGGVRLIVINKNDGLEYLTLSLVCTEYDYDVTVEDSQGRIILLSDEGEKIKSKSIFRRELKALKPGEEMVEEINLDKLFDLSGQGEYKVTISRSYSISKPLTNGAYLRGKAISNQVIVKVREKGALAIDQKQSPDNITTDGQDLKLIIMPEKDIFNIRETLATSGNGIIAIDLIKNVTIKVICKNDSPNDLIVPVDDSEYYYDVELRDSHGEVIPLSNQGKQIKGQSISTHRYTILKPGEEMIEEINLNNLFTLSGTGEYQVIASRFFYKEKDYSAGSDYTHAKAKSNQIAISVHE